MSSVTTPMTEQTAKRMPAAARRELILAAASREFGTFGYAGTTTARIASAAGISQPYVVRMFGTKEKLFVEALERALARLLLTFRAEIERGSASTADEGPLSRRLGTAYVGLVADRGLLLVLMQAFVTGHDDVIGARARAGFLEIYALLRDEGGLSPQEVTDFLSAGMLMNTLLAIGLPAHCGDSADGLELMASTFGGKIDEVLDIAGPEADHHGSAVTHQDGPHD